MKAYSQDLRERVLAAQFSVSISFVAKLACRQRRHGTVAALPRGRRPAPRWMPRP